MPNTSQPEIIRFGRDMTLRWPCRRGDFIMWMGYSDIFAEPDSIQMYDIWEMRSGDHVTITNRTDDFPSWFELHPTEVCNTLVGPMMAKMDKGYKPGDPVKGPNLWRVKSGHRVAWVGAERPERPSAKGILAILECSDCALVAGEGSWGSIEEFGCFGAPTTPQMKPDDAIRCQAAVKLARRLGVPRMSGSEWRLG